MSQFKKQRANKIFFRLENVSNVSIRVKIASILI